MREKLIQILTKTFEEEGTWKDPRAGAELILAPFRCDNCKHFKVEGGFTECLHRDNRWPDRDYDGEEHLSPRADFFCALFDEKP